MVGGCCGTTPQHVRAMREALDRLAPGRAAARVDRRARRRGRRPPRPPSLTTTAAADGLARKLDAGEFLVTVELDPPRGHNIEKLVQGAKLLKERGVEIVDINDGSLGRVRMSVLPTAILVREATGLDINMHFTCRDRNLMGIQADVLGAHAMDIRNILAMTGDPPRTGDYVNATAVFDVDAIGLIRILTEMNRGLDATGNSIGEPTSFCVGMALNPAAEEPAREMERFLAKVEAGARWAQTQPVYDLEVLERFFGRTRHPSRSWSASCRFTPRVTPSSCTTRCRASPCPTPSGRGCGRRASAGFAWGSRPPRPSSRMCAARTPAPTSCRPSAASRSWLRSSTRFIDTHSTRAALAPKRGRCSRGDHGTGPRLPLRLGSGPPDPRAAPSSPVDLLEACLERDRRARTPALRRGWSSTATPRCARPASAPPRRAAGASSGALHGVPVALKDIFDAAGLPTRAGRRPSPTAAHRRRGLGGAACAPQGAVIMGKVVHDVLRAHGSRPDAQPVEPRAHTRRLVERLGRGGGRPHGAARAGHADGGLDPPARRLLRGGGLQGDARAHPRHRRGAAGRGAWTTSGIFCRSVEDAALALGVMAGHDASDPPRPARCRWTTIARRAARSGPAADRHPPVPRRARGAGDGGPRGGHGARRSGAPARTVIEVALPPAFEGLHDLGQRVVRVEAAAFHRDLFARHADRYPPRLKEAVELGRTISGVEFLEAQAARRRFRAEMTAVAGRFDALLSPTAPGPAPKGIDVHRRPLVLRPVELRRDARHLAAQRARRPAPAAGHPARGRAVGGDAAPRRGVLVRARHRVRGGARVLDVKIQGGQVLDGTGAPAARADVGSRATASRSSATSPREPRGAHLDALGPHRDARVHRHALALRLAALGQRRAPSPRSARA